MKAVPTLPSSQTKQYDSDFLPLKTSVMEFQNPLSQNEMHTDSIKRSRTFFRALVLKTLIANRLNHSSSAERLICSTTRATLCLKILKHFFPIIARRRRARHKILFLVR